MKMRTFLTFILMFCATCIADAANYLTFSAEEESSTFSIMKFGDNEPNIQYSVDEGKTWIDLTESKTVVLKSKGDKAILRGVNFDGFSTKDSYTYFTMSGKIAASGNVMSLIDSIGETTTIPNKYCFSYLFKNCESLTKAPELPATTLKGYCYLSMFSGCTSLTKAPELPATSMEDVCYGRMFEPHTSAQTTGNSNGDLLLLKHVPGLFEPHTSAGTACHHLGGKMLRIHVLWMHEPHESTGITKHRLSRILL